MVLYICNKCNKNFTRKQCYQAHINRKYSCILTENFNRNLELEENNKQYDESNKELTKKNNKLENRINELEDRNNELEDRNNKLECNNKILNNLLDKFIKNNNITNKNTKDNNDDIKIKKIQEYVYIIRECDFVRLNENIYKIGRTAKANPEDRFQKYRKGTEIVGFFGVNDSVECENKIIKCFSNHTNIKKMNEYGKEYFQGNKNELIKEIVQIVENYNT
jgi:hypothetical protein